MSISTVPLVLTRLTALAKARLPDVDVILGQPSADPEDSCLMFAFTGTPAEAAVDDDRTREEIARERDRERYTITNLASAWGSSDTDAEEAMNNTYALVDAVAGLVAEDQTLDGACMRAMVSATRLALSQTSRGAVAVVQFVIRVDAFTRRAA